MCYKINDAKTVKNPVYYFMLANHRVYYRLAGLTGTFKIIISALYYQVSFAKGQ